MPSLISLTPQPDLCKPHVHLTYYMKSELRVCGNSPQSRRWYWWWKKFCFTTISIDKLLDRHSSNYIIPHFCTLCRNTYYASVKIFYFRKYYWMNKTTMLVTIQEVYEITWLSFLIKSQWCVYLIILVNQNVLKNVSVMSSVPLLFQNFHYLIKLLTSKYSLSVYFVTYDCFIV